MSEARSTTTTRSSIPTYRPLIRVRGQRGLPIIPIGPVHTWLMHWCEMDQRTIPCLMQECQPCRVFQNRRPLSYVAVLHLVPGDAGPKWSPAVLEIPLSTGLRLSELRNHTLGLKRERPRGPVLVGTFTTATPLPPLTTFDIVPTLLRLWRLPSSVQLRLLAHSDLQMWNVAYD